ncbi:L-lactate dehydrogenase [Desulfofundulus thermobenzoicus]|uniref:L-lactate dehydrogenase n=1 Tax=Desulfofundulus thermobenzoicus TaxID=29376 RepID=A0A6N7IT27_9FIRM|nr:L-lactate dehydrogenase [Desulfofundulus thermobenzoicus]HHW45140.1 L-lactate dehydrogenase [Desulfotomaculum sp.]
MPVNDKRKIAVVGVGAVGSASAYAVMMSGLVSELVLVDINRERAEGEAMDLAHGASFIKPIRIYAGDYGDCRDADIIIFSAGVNQKPGETRLDLVQRNFAILKETLPHLLPLAGDGILLVVTNPVDVLTYAALRLTNLPPNRVMGSGTVLDSSRFRYLLSACCQVEPRNIHAYVVGEHGDTEVPLWSLANIAGIPVQEFCCWRGVPCIKTDDITRRVREAAYEVIARKGATFYAIGLAVKRICESILRDENSILTVSGLVDGQYGIQDVCFSLPSIVNREGRARVLSVPLAREEEEALKHSAGVLKSILEHLDLPHGNLT